MILYCAKDLEGIAGFVSWQRIDRSSQQPRPVGVREEYTQWVHPCQWIKLSIPLLPLVYMRAEPSRVFVSLTVLYSVKYSTSARKYQSLHSRYIGRLGHSRAPTAQQTREREIQSREEPKLSTRMRSTRFVHIVSTILHVVEKQWLTNVPENLREIAFPPSRIWTRNKQKRS